MVCPYAWDAPGGVQSHIAGLSAALTVRGHDVEVLTPVADPDAVPPAGVFAGASSSPTLPPATVARPAGAGMLLMSIATGSEVKPAAGTVPSG